MGTELTIGKVARRAGVNIQTLRYYERRRLLIPNARRKSGYRLYDEGAIRRVVFIKNAQNLGFRLEEIGDLLRLRVSPGAQNGKVRRKALEKLTEIRRKLVKLGALQRSLQHLIRTCHAGKTAGPCPILRSLEAM